MLDNKIKQEIEFLLNQRDYSLTEKHIRRALELLEICYEETQNRPTLIYKKDSISTTTFGKLEDKFDLIEYTGDKPPQVIR